MPKVAITMSQALLFDLDLLAELDSPGAPNRSATALRLLARGIAEEKTRALGAAIELRTAPGWAAAAAAAVALGVPQEAVETIGAMRVPKAPPKLDGALVAALARALAAA